MLSREELEQVPRRYRLFLKLFMRFPNLRFPYFVVRKLPWFEGIFWALLVPVFLVVYFFFTFWFYLALSLLVGFPFNVIIWLLIPSVLFIMFLRIQFERIILFWRSLRSQSNDWDIPKLTEEFSLLIEKQHKKRETAHAHKV